MKKLRWIVLILLAALQVAHAQQPPAPQKRRPRIGLALAGGSARGLAHVGVLKWFAEHRIPVDFIAGTSMGGLVGGLYASGYNAEEIEAFLRDANWPEVFQTSAPYPDASFRRKEDLRDLPSQFEIGLRGGLRFPTGLNAGHGVELLISRFAAPYADMRSFDDLPTPFRCVAADLVEGTQVVFSAGDLDRALRATMAIPVVFAPVREGNRVLVDGGTLNNLPVDVVKAMGADIIIAVALPSPDTDPGSSLISVADRAITIMLESNERRNLQLADLILMPDMTGTFATDFDLYARLARRGYDEAARKGRFLETLAVDEGTWQDYLAERRARRRDPAITPRFLEIEGASGPRRERIEKELRNLIGVPLDRKRIEHALTRITGQGRYESAQYDAVQRNGEDGLRITLREKTHAPPSLKLLLSIEGYDPDEQRFALGARLSFLDAGGPFSEWRTDFSLGSPNRIASEYYWRIAGGPVFLAPRGFIDYSRRGFYQDGSRLAELSREELGAGLDLGFVAGRSSEFRFGYEVSRTSEFVSTGTPVVPKVEGIFNSVRAGWTFEALDNPLIPRRGLRIATGLRWVLDGPQVQQEFPVFDTEILAAAPIRGRYSMIARFAGGTTAGRASPIPPFRLGGPLRLGALAVDQLQGNNYYLGSFTFLRAFSRRPLSFLERTYATLTYELGDAFDDVGASNPFHTGTVGLMSETPFGAVFIGGSFGQSGERKIFFRLGRVF